MILMKGSTRVLEKPLEEQTGSTSQLKLLSIYGVTSYSQLLNVPLTIINTTGQASTISINVNSLGVKSLKYKGSTTLPSNLFIMNTMYTIMYDGTDFILQLLSVNSGVNSFYTQEIPNAVLSLTNSSTSSDITTAFGGASNLVDFMNSLEDTDHISYIVDSTTNQILSVLCTTAITTTSNNVETETDTIYILNPLNKKIVTLEFTRTPSAATYDSVTISNTNLESSDNKVTSLSSSSTDSQYPSAKCVYDIVGNIESILEDLDIGGGI